MPTEVYTNILNQEDIIFELRSALASIIPAARGEQSGSSRSSAKATLESAPPLDAAMRALNRSFAGPGPTKKREEQKILLSMRNPVQKDLMTGFDFGYHADLKVELDTDEEHRNREAIQTQLEALFVASAQRNLEEAAASSSALPFPARSPEANLAQSLCASYYFHLGLSEKQIRLDFRDYFSLNGLAMMPADFNWPRFLNTPVRFHLLSDFYPLSMLLPDNAECNLLKEFGVPFDILVTGKAEAKSALKTYIHPLKFSLFNHHHNNRARAVYKAIDSCHSIAELTRILKNQCVLFGITYALSKEETSVSVSLPENFMSASRHTVRGTFTAALVQTLSILGHLPLPGTAAVAAPEASSLSWLLPHLSERDKAGAVMASMRATVRRM